MSENTHPSIFSGNNPGSHSVPDNRTAGTRPGAKHILQINGIDYTFCWCPPGEFIMGSPESETGRDSDETPHHVRLSRGFFLLETPVTQRMWENVMGTSIYQQAISASVNLKYSSIAPDYPMFYVNWSESAEFCRKLSELSGEDFRLPTEAQWEYACRAGSTGAFGGTGSLESMAWYAENSGSVPHEVRCNAPNAWGLYDMHGSVWEWCSDWYEVNYYSNSPHEDPGGPSNGSRRLVRGGCYFDSARGCRSANRGGRDPDYRDYLGLRPLLFLAAE